MKGTSINSSSLELAGPKLDIMSFSEAKSVEKFSLKRKKVMKSYVKGWSSFPSGSRRAGVVALLNLYRNDASRRKVSLW